MLLLYFFKVYRSLSSLPRLGSLRFFLFFLVAVSFSLFAVKADPSQDRSYEIWSPADFSLLSPLYYAPPSSHEGKRIQVPIILNLDQPGYESGFYPALRFDISVSGWDVYTHPKATLSQLVSGNYVFLPPGDVMERIRSSCSHGGNYLTAHFYGCAALVRGIIKRKTVGRKCFVFYTCDYFANYLFVEEAYVIEENSSKIWEAYLSSGIELIQFFLGKGKFFTFTK